MEKTAEIISQSSSINLISKTISTTRSSLSNTSNTIGRIQKIIETKTKVRSDLFFKNQNLERRRREASKRREYEDQIEASKVSTNIQFGLRVASSSNQGPLSRILSFLGYMGAGWIIENLPTWIAMGREFIERMKRARQIMYSIPQTMWRILQSFGNSLRFIGRDILNLDFTDSSGDIRNSFSELTDTMELLGTQIVDGFKMLLEPTGEVDIPSTGEQQPDAEFPEVPAPTPGGVTSQSKSGKLQPIHYQALDIIAAPESGGSYNAMNQGTIQDKIVGSTLDSKTQIKKNLTDMTIGEVLQRQQWLMDKKNPQISDYGVYAAGKYQFIPNTLPGVMSSAGLSPQDKFSPENQDLMAISLVQQRGIQPWTIGGSRYSKKEVEIVERARKTPLSKSTSTAPPLRPTVTPQTPLSTNFAAVTGTSGASQGNKPLSIPYSPFKPGSGATITSGKGMRWGRPHTGYDLAASPGTPLYAYFPGKVTHIGLDGTSSSAGYGNWVVWKDDMYGAYHFFGHMKDRPPVSVGQTVNQGTLMGTVGSTGRSTGPHLHWEISNNPPKSNGQFTSYEDPGSWLKKHPLKKSDVSPQLAKIPSEKQTIASKTQPKIFSATQQQTIASKTQPKISSATQQQRFVAESVKPERMGQQFLFIDDRTPDQEYSSSGSGGSYVSGILDKISEFDLLNNFMKQKLLLDFNYL